jgi:propanol-preferring alcohol dehydrogenase
VTLGQRVGIILHAAGLTKVISETRPLEQVNEAIADVEAGRVAARIVLEP